MLARIRKALVAGVGAGIAAVVASLTSVLADGQMSGDELGLLAAAFVGAAVTVGYATFRIPNAQ